MRRVSFLLLLWALWSPTASAQAIDTIRVGSPSLDPTLLELGSFTVDSFRRVEGTDTPLSSTSLTIKKRGGQIEIHSVHASSADTTTGIIIAREDNLALIHQKVKARGDSASVTVGDGFLTAWVALPGEPVALWDGALDSPVFPVEGQIPWLFPLLPLADGYVVAIPYYSPWAGREEWSTIRVLGSDRIARGSMEIECWKVDGGELFSGYTATYWIDKESRRVIQGVARGSESGPEFWSWMRLP